TAACAWRSRLGIPSPRLLTSTDAQTGLLTLDRIRFANQGLKCHYNPARGGCAYGQTGKPLGSTLAQPDPSGRNFRLPRFTRDVGQTRPDRKRGGNAHPGARSLRDVRAPLPRAANPIGRSGVSRPQPFGYTHPALSV